MNPHNLLVFTDMDGSLLDHHTYSHEPADTLLDQLASLGIPVIANTSKTRAELERLLTELHNTEAFIAENGAAIYLPKQRFVEQPDETESLGQYWVKSFAEPRAHWQKLITNLESDFHRCFTTFAEAGVEGIIDMTGLDHLGAQLAAQREYGEPVKWLGSEEQKTLFFSKLEEQGAQILHGGRFSHVSGHCDKGVALHWLASCYATYINDGQPLITAALGDSQNDIAMLEAADYAVVIRSPAHQAPSVNKKHAQETVFNTNKYGPEGWVEGMTHVLHGLEHKLELN